MAKARDCVEFDRRWNERLDDGGMATEAGARRRAMAEHSAGCERCRGREVIFAEVEAALASPALAPLATPEAIARWVAAASAARPAPAPAGMRATRRPRRLRETGQRLGRAVAIAASVLIGTNLALPLLYPIEAATPAQRDWAMSSPFEEACVEACVEASTLAQGLVDKVSTPVEHPVTDPIGLVAAAPPPFKPTQYQLAEAAAPPASESVEPARFELISGSTKQAFRFLTGSTSDEIEDTEVVGGY